jgi:hypothetical protein
MQDDVAYDLLENDDFLQNPHFDDNVILHQIGGENLFGEMGELPLLLHPISKGNRDLIHALPEFNDLSNKLIEPRIKDALVDLFMYYKHGLYKDIVGDIGKTQTSLCNAYNIPPGTFRGWYVRRKERKPLFESTGRPRLVPMTVIQQMRDDNIRGQRYNTANEGGEAFERDLYKHMRAHRVDTSQAGALTSLGMSRATFYRTKAEVGDEHTAGVIAVPRIKASQDIRNFYTMYCCLMAFGKELAG